MPGIRPFSLAGKKAVLATMHGNERAITPLVKACFGLTVRLPTGFDTDRFGTFSRDVERAGSQLDAARAKIATAFEHDSEASVGLASEGSFGPHPLMPFAAFGREIVVLRDRASGLELVGHHAGFSTNFSHVTVVDKEEAVAFAKVIGLPAHGLIVIGMTDRRPAVDRLLRKDLDTMSDLCAAVVEAIALCGAAHVETDMRAYRNPTRMRAIKRATINLVRQYPGKCPKWDRPGFAVTERLFRLPCSWCGAPTNKVKTDVLVCKSFGHRVEKAVEAITTDPGHCDNCNP